MMTAFQTFSTQKPIQTEEPQVFILELEEVSSQQTALALSAAFKQLALFAKLTSSLLKDHLRSFLVVFVIMLSVLTALQSVVSIKPLKVMKDSATTVKVMKKM
jgi:hypothetical protein